MIYALNVYDIIDGQEAIYAEYARRAGAIFETLDGSLIAAGDKPIRQILGQTRNHFALAQFADEATFDQLMAALAAEDLHRLREAATANYLWTLYRPWDFG